MKVITENETSLSGKSQTQWTYFWESLPNHFQLQFLLKIPINKYISNIIFIRPLILDINHLLNSPFANWAFWNKSKSAFHFVSSCPNCWVRWDTRHLPVYRVWFYWTSCKIVVYSYKSNNWTIIDYFVVYLLWFMIYFWGKSSLYP